MLKSIGRRTRIKSLIFPPTNNPLSVESRRGDGANLKFIALFVRTCSLSWSCFHINFEFVEFGEQFNGCVRKALVLQLIRSTCGEENSLLNLRSTCSCREGEPFG